MSGPACAGCGRQVALRGRTSDGLICSACCARRRTGVCSVCGQEGRIAGRAPDGGPWCGRCMKRHKIAVEVEQTRLVIVAAVAAVEPHLPADVISDALVEATPLTKHLRALRQRLADDPDALTDGPTSTLAPLDRFARALAAAGAEHVRPRHPACVRCGRHQPRKSRLGDGGLCPGCYATAAKQPCPRCGIVRRRYQRDASGRPLCYMCVRDQRRHDERNALTTRITDELHATIAGDLDRQVVLTIVEQVAPRLQDLRLLASQLAGPDALTDRPPVRLARLIAALAAAGAERDLPILTCHGCGQPAGPQPAFTHGRVRCPPCMRRCQGCGRDSRQTGENVCHRCRRDYHRRRGTCQLCASPERLLDEQGRCRTCHKRSQRRCTDCGQPGRRTRHGQVWVCQTCALRRSVDELLPETADNPLAMLRPALLAATPHTTRMWLAQPRTIELLTALRCGRLPLSHDGLDRLPAGRHIEHLRDMLVAAGALPPDPDRQVTRWIRDLPDLLAKMPETDTRIVRAWLHWKVLPRLRRRAEAGDDILGRTTDARQALLQVRAFLAGLHANHRRLATCRQQDVDAWFAVGTAHRHRIRPFLAWAQRRRHLPSAIELPPKYRGMPNTPTDSEHRWLTARRLVTDDSISPDDRVAAALVVLYAQPLARIVALTTDHIDRDGQTVTVALGTDRLELPEPFATLITGLPMPRSGGPAAQLPAPWLFPGSRAGRHIRPVALAKRLRDLGIDPQPMRLSALHQLAAELPPAILASMLGIRATTAARWTGTAGGNWTNYAARGP